MPNEKPHLRDDPGESWREMMVEKMGENQDETVCRRRWPRSVKICDAVQAFAPVQDLVVTRTGDMSCPRCVVPSTGIVSNTCSSK